jgi:hypothetical protein
MPVRFAFHGIKALTLSNDVRARWSRSNGGDVEAPPSPHAGCRKTTRSGSANGSGASSVAFSVLKTATAAPIATLNVTMMTREEAGVLRSVRTA